MDETFVRDFSKRPAEFSYRRLLKQPLTDDIAHFRAFGHSSLGGAAIGATFTADPSTIRRLTSSMKPVPAAEIAKTWSDTLGDPYGFPGFNITAQPSLIGTWVAWSILDPEGSHDYFTYFFWNPERREAWYYYWSQ